PPPVNRWDDWPSARRVATFGYPRINSYVPIPAAFRSLSRPSSPLRAYASALRPSLLSLLSVTAKDAANGTLLARFCPRKEYVFPIASVTVLQPMTPDTPEGIPGQPMQTIPDDRRTLVLTTSSSMSKNLPSASLPHRTPQAPRGG